jgi:hypothetical protein
MVIQVIDRGYRQVTTPAIEYKLISQHAMLNASSSDDRDCFCKQKLRG